MNDSIPTPRAVQGLTLVELMVTLGVMVVLTLTVVPVYTGMRDKHHIAAATEAVNAQITLARSEAGKRSATVYVAIEDGSNWAVGVSEVTGCDPEGGGTDCTLSYVESDGTAVTKTHTITSTDYPGVSIAASSPSQIGFYSVRGTADSGTVTINSDSYQTRVEVSAMGRVRVCSPSGSTKVGRYPDC